jgi:hypothetical protein
MRLKNTTRGQTQREGSIITHPPPERKMEHGGHRGHRNNGVLRADTNGAGSCA